LLLAFKGVAWILFERLPSNFTKPGIQASNMSHITQLPLDCLRQIASFLRPELLASFELSSKRWTLIVGWNVLWEDQLKQLEKLGGHVIRAGVNSLSSLFPPSATPKAKVKALFDVLTEFRKVPSNGSNTPDPQNQPPTVKVIMVGDFGVGKTVRNNVAIHPPIHPRLTNFSFPSCSPSTVSQRPLHSTYYF